ncbi:MAG TPA: hypothetical protein VH596_16605 [Terriglobales bacterium]|jgi:hypothetical protein
MRRISGSTIVLAVLISSAVAQTRIGRFTSAPSAGHFIGIGRPAVSVRTHRFFHPGYGYYGVPFFYSDYDEPYEVEYAPQEAPPNPVPVMQAKPEPVPDPVLLELQGNQWVRVENFTPEKSTPNLSGPVSPLPPALLVFRDGHTEEVSSYSIIGPTIYTKSNYWNTGKWTRKIQIADLDVPETVSRNEQRGLHFELPSSPDEIMIRP